VPESGIPLSEWSGSGATRELRETIIEFSAAALAAHEATLRRSHPWTADSAGVMAQCLDALGRTGEAAEIRQRYGLARSAQDASRARERPLPC